MRTSPFLVLAMLLLTAGVSGCLGEEGASAAFGVADAPAGDAPWNATGAATLGWILGAGEHVFLGDLVVGVKSHEQCPSASFVVPAGTSRLRIALGPGQGVGPYVVSVSSPDGVTYARHVVPAAVEHEAEDPPAGVWRVEVKPSGATANQRLDVQVEMGGVGGGAPAEVLMQLDPDCLL